MNNTVQGELGVPVRTPYIKTANGVSGGDVVSTGATTTVQGGTITAEQANLSTAPGQTTAAPEVPQKPLTLLEQFHPSLDPSKVQMTFDDKTGRLRVVPIEQATEAEAQTVAEDGLPALAEQHQTVPGGSEATAAAAAQSGLGAENAQLRNDVQQLTQLVTIMAQSQMSGKPLGELLGMAAPSAPAQPDFSDVDLYQPAQLATFIQQTVQGAIQGAIGPHQQTLEGARRRQEYDAVAAQHGADPAFNTKIVQALTLVKDNPGLTVSQGFDIVNRIATAILPAAATTPAPTPAPTAKPATRTITAEQAQQKADQAQRLPASNSGVRGAGAPSMPAHIKGLGQMIAWNLQQAHSTGQ